MLISKSLNNNAIIKKINDGSVGVIPTDTIYGLVCNAYNINACLKLYKIKHRNNKPGTIVAANIDQIESLGI